MMFVGEQKDFIENSAIICKVMHVVWCRENDEYYGVFGGANPPTIRKMDWKIRALEMEILETSKDEERG